MYRVYIETERQDLFDVSIVIAMRFHISGSVTNEQISNAFNKAVRAHEILGTRVKLDSNGKAYYDKLGKENEQSDLNTVSNGNKIYFEANDWQDIIHREEKKRFKIEEGEFIRGFVYKSGGEVNGEGANFLLQLTLRLHS